MWYCVLLCAAGPISEAASDQRRPPTALTLSHCPQNISAGKSRGKPKFSTEKMNAGLQLQERAQCQENLWNFVIFNFSEEQMKQAAGPTAKSHHLKAFAPFIARVFPIQSFNLSHFHFLNIGQMIEADWQRLNNLKRWKRPSEGSQMLVVSLRNWPPLSLLLFWLLPRSWRKISVKMNLWKWIFIKMLLSVLND